MAFWNYGLFYSRLKTVQRAKSRRSTLALQLERLEDRTMPSADLLAPAFEPILVVDPEASIVSQHEPAPVVVPADPVLVGAAPVSLPDGAIPITWLGEETYAMEGQWIVQLDGVSGTPAQQSAQAANLLVGLAGVPSLTPLSYLGSDGTFLIQAPPDVGFAELEAALSTLPGFQYVEPNFVLWATAITPNDPFFSELYGLNNTGQTGGTAGADIDAPEAWDLSTGRPGVVVGVIDTGVDYTHVDLAANMWTNPGETPGDGVDNDGNGFIDDYYGYDFVGAGDSDPFDDNAHGTHVSGTIGAVGDNGVGVVGVNWDVQIMALKFLDANGSGSTADAVEAINYATMMNLNGVNVVVTNNSWGGGGYSQSLYDAIAASGAAGMLFVAAAGNATNDNDQSAFYPAYYELDNIIAVAATNSNDALASFSNYGAASVDIAAPGVNVLSTVPGNAYDYFSGTSMASPHVAGVAALAWSVDPNATYQEIRDALLVGADPVAALNGVTATGGRLNAFNTLEIISASAVTVFSADFTDDVGDPNLDGFTIDNKGAPAPGLWKLSTRRGSDPGHSSVDSMYFGTASGNYNIGDTAGRITSPVIDIPAAAIAAQLSFAYFLETEDFTGFDVAKVLISKDGGAFTSIASNDGGPILDPTTGWNTVVLDLTAYVGSAIQIQFDFDTIDASFNNHEGWYVDDVKVVAYMPVPGGPDVGDTLATATAAALTTGHYAKVESIGNGPALAKDVDVYEFTAAAGATLTASTSLPAGGRSMDTILRLFDSDGVELAINDDSGPGEFYSLLTYTFLSAGTYYIGVSGYNNSAYDPETVGSGVAGSTGDYQLDLLLPRILTWDGGGADANWTTAENWAGDVAPVAGDAVVFAAGAARLTNTNDFAAGTNFASIAFTGGGYSISGNAVTLSAGLINTAGANVLNLPITLDGAQTFSANATTTLQVDGTVANAGFLLTVDGAGTVKLTNGISGSGGLTKTGDGTLVLSKSNTYSGPTILNAGTLALGSNSAVGTGTLTLNAGTLRADGAGRTLTNAVTLGGDAIIGGTLNLTLSGATTLTGNRTLTVTNTALSTLSGVVGESGGTWSLTKAGTGQLVLSKSNTFAGGTILSAGALAVGNNGAVGTGTLTLNGGTLLASGAARTLTNFVTLGGNVTIGGTLPLTLSGAVTLTGNRTLTVNNIGLTTLSGVIGQSGGTWSLTKAGTGTLLLLGNNTFTGGTTLSAGTLAVGHNVAVGTGKLTLNGGTLTASGAARTLNNSVTLGGNVTIGGTLNLTLTGAISLTGNRTLTITNTGLTTLSGVISQNGGTRSLTKAGSGTLLLSGINTYAGGTTLSAGTLLVGHNSAVGTGRLTLTGGTLTASGGARTLTNVLTLGGNVTIGGTLNLTLSGAATLTGDRTLTVTNTGLTTLSGVIDQSGGKWSLTKAGTGTLVLSGNSTYAGGTTLSAGTLAVGHNSAVGTGTLTLTGGTLTASGAARTLTNAVTLGGNVTIGGTLDLTLSGAAKLTADRTLTVTNTGLTTLSGVISQTLPGFGITKAGTETLVLSGHNTYTGATTVSAGTLIVNGTQTGSAVIVKSGAILGGDGSVGTINVKSDGTLSPGSSPAILQTRSLILDSGSTFVVELNGASAGSGYDQLSVTGTVNLVTSSLSLTLPTLGFKPAVGDTFTIIDNDGTDAVVGSFSGLFQGATITINNIDLEISYTGGTGNDVVLTRIS